MNTKTSAYERDCEREIRANPNHTMIWRALTSRIIYSLTSLPSFEYDISVTNYCSRKTIEALCATCDEWFNDKEACFEQDDKKKYRSAVGSWLLPSVLVFLTVNFMVIFHQKARPANFQKTQSHSSKFFFMEGQKSSFKIKLIVSDLLLGYTSRRDYKNHGWSNSMARRLFQ